MSMINSCLVEEHENVKINSGPDCQYDTLSGVVTHPNVDAIKITSFRHDLKLI